MLTRTTTLFGAVVAIVCFFILLSERVTEIHSSIHSRQHIARRHWDDRSDEKHTSLEEQDISLKRLPHQARDMLSSSHLSDSSLGAGQRSQSHIGEGSKPQFGNHHTDIPESVVSMEQDQELDDSGTDEDPIVPGENPSRYNVLFLMSDDMRAQISPYDGPHSTYESPKLKTPNFQRLAAKSLVMSNLFVQYSLCGPSRTSMLTSRRPDVTRIYDNDHYWRQEGGNFTTMPQFFKDQGYFTYGVGKLFHKGLSSNNNDPISWSMRYRRTPSPESNFLERRGLGEGAGWLSVPDEELELQPLSDTLAVTRVKELLRELAPAARSGKQNFFLGLGFKKPHLSFVCPEKYFKLYPLEQEPQYLAEKPWQEPEVRRGCNLRNITFVGDSGKLPDNTLRHLRQAYFACISYIDDLLGEILDALESLNLAKSTVVAFVADHGYHLGENGFFGKQRLRDSCNRVPMMIHVPGQTDAGVQSRVVAQGLDVFPTVVEAAGLTPPPPCPKDSSKVRLCTEGRSLLPLVDDPLEGEDSAAAISQVRSGNRFMRYGIRTKTHRYTQWAELSESTGRYSLVDETPFFYTELFDLSSDREERHNLSADPSYATVRAELRRRLEQSLAR